MKQKRKLPHTRARRLSRITLFTALTLTGISLLSLVWRLNFWLELFSTYIPQILLSVAAMGMLLFAFAIYINISEGWAALKGAFLHRLPLLTLLAVFSAILFIFPIVTPVRAEIDPSANADLRILSFNKLYKNDDYTQIANYIHNRDPDIVGFQEIYIDEAADLAARMGYEYWHVASCGCSAYGSDLALLSRFPIEAAEMAFEDKLGGVLRGEVEIAADTKLIVYVAHIVPPYTNGQYSIRDNMLNELAAQINAEQDPVVLMGDFNSTIYSIDMRRLSTALDSVVVSGARPWPACSWNGFSDVLCARIDHIFVPVDSTIKELPNTGPYIGSDHRPVDIDLAI